ncbi:AI-2E family transporter [Phytohabitans flavus]|uniref:AI-2E family transporter n=1 Tax=Phytohabitans flavus TaxID=1076124 RepID=A0A6F8XQ04_9ACTN|nr:AI-2E family transporter [Phytohabitans flavus]BCB75914.1 AI-2E family transporter [Phytohabitans flavus]
MVSADTRTTARHTLVVIGLLLLTALLIFFITHTARVLVWIIVAAFFAVALYPAVSWTERKLAWCRRWLAALMVFLAVSLLLAGLVAALVVPLIREGIQLYDDLPQIAQDVKAGRGPAGRLAERFHVLDYVESHSEQIRQRATDLAPPAIAFLTGIAATVIGAISVFVLAYLMVLQAPRLVDGFLGAFEPRLAGRIRRVGSACARTITGYITGNLLISLVAGVLTFIVLFILGVPFAGLIALFVAIADLLPLVGATIGATVAILAGFTHSVVAGIVLIAFFIVYQQLENHLLQPVVFSRTVKLSPLTVLIAVLLAAQLAGILGALLAIPVASMIQIIGRDMWEAHKARLGDQRPIGPKQKSSDT